MPCLRQRCQQCDDQGHICQDAGTLLKRRCRGRGIRAAEMGLFAPGSRTGAPTGAWQREAVSSPSNVRSGKVLCCEESLANSNSNSSNSNISSFRTSESRPCLRMGTDPALLTFCRPTPKQTSCICLQAMRHRRHNSLTSTACKTPPIGEASLSTYRSSY